MRCIVFVFAFFSVSLLLSDALVKRVHLTPTSHMKAKAAHLTAKGEEYKTKISFCLANKLSHTHTSDRLHFGVHLGLF